MRLIRCYGSRLRIITLASSPRCPTYQHLPSGIAATKLRLQDCVDTAHTTVRPPRCTTASTGGPTAASGARCWLRWPSLTDGGRMGGRRGRPRQHPRQHLRQGAPLRPRRQRRARAQGIGPSRGGQTTKVHALTDVLDRPGVLLLTPGNSSDVTTAPAVLALASGRIRRLSADKGPHGLRCRLAARRPARQRHHARHPGQARPQAPHPARQAPLSRALAHRGHVQPAEGFPPHRHPAHDKLARNYASTLALAAVVTFWR